MGPWEIFAWIAMVCCSVMLVGVTTANATCNVCGYCGIRTLLGVCDEAP